MCVFTLLFVIYLIKVMALHFQLFDEVKKFFFGGGGMELLQREEPKKKKRRRNPPLMNITCPRLQPERYIPNLSVFFLYFYSPPLRCVCQLGGVSIFWTGSRDGPESRETPSDKNPAGKNLEELPLKITPL